MLLSTPSHDAMNAGSTPAMAMEDVATQHSSLKALDGVEATGGIDNAPTM